MQTWTEGATDLAFTRYLSQDVRFMVAVGMGGGGVMVAR